MKIGFSLGRCVRDIALEKVDINDVLVIITRTYAKDILDMLNVIEEYRYEPTYLKGIDAELCTTIATKLWNSGKIHQPRLNGYQPPTINNDYVWMDIVPTVADMSETAKSAWVQYRTLLAFGDEIVPDDPGQSIAVGVRW